MENLSRLVRYRSDALSRVMLPAKYITGWKDKICTEWVWGAFRDWFNSEYPLLEGSFNKNGFMTLFYRVSNTQKSRMTRGQDKIPTVKYMDAKAHAQALHK